MIAQVRPYHDNFGSGRHQLGSRFIDPNRINQHVSTVLFTLEGIKRAASSLRKMEFDALSGRDIILVSLPEVSLSFGEVVRLCPTDNPTLQALAVRLEAECDVGLGTYINPWFAAERQLNRLQLKRQNAAALLWAELAQFYGRDNQFPLRVH